MDHLPAKIECVINYSPRGQISKERLKIKVSPWVSRELIMKQILVISIQPSPREAVTVLGRNWAARKVTVRNRLAPGSCRPTAGSQEADLPAACQHGHTPTDTYTPSQGYPHLWDVSIWQEKHSKIKSIYRNSDQR